MGAHAASGALAWVTLNPILLGGIMGGVTTLGNRYIARCPSARGLGLDLAIGIGGGAILGGVGGWAGGALVGADAPAAAPIGAQLGSVSASVWGNNVVNWINAFGDPL